jgi:hypothetical protein
MLVSRGLDERRFIVIIGTVSKAGTINGRDGSGEAWAAV